MSDSVKRSPARLCWIEVKLCYYGCLQQYSLAFVPCFLFFVCFPSLSRHVSLFRIILSAQQSSAVLGKQNVVLLLVSLASRIASAFLCLLFFSWILLLGWVYVVFSYPVRQHLTCLLDFFATLDLLCLTVCIHIIRISPGWRVRKDTGGAADVVGLQEQFNEKNTTSLVGSPLPAHACVPTVFQRDSRTHQRISTGWCARQRDQEVFLGDS